MLPTLAEAASAANISTATYVRLLIIGHLEGGTLPPPPAKPKRKRA